MYVMYTNHVCTHTHAQKEKVFKMERAIERLKEMRVKLDEPAV